MRVGYFKQLQEWRWFGVHKYSTCTYVTFWKLFVAWDKKRVKEGQS